MLLSIGAAPVTQHCRPALAARPQYRRTVVRAAQESPVTESTPSNSSSVCETCGVDLTKAPRACDKGGRVVGGMGALPGFGWWPIKAYRPCPALISAGMQYKRKGQLTNDMLFPVSKKRTGE